MSTPTTTVTGAIDLNRRIVAVAAILSFVAAFLVVFPSDVGASSHTCNGLSATIVGTPGDDVLHGTDGVDVIVGLAGADVIFGHDGNDVICSGPGPDRIWAGVGNDVVYGNGGNDRIKGDLGRDHLFAGNGNDVVAGQAGADLLYGGSGRDKLAGGRGSDMLMGGDGNDRMFGQDGIDVLHGEANTDFCDSQGDTLVGCELPQVAGPTGLAAYESHMLTLINVERTNRGLAAIDRHPDLDSYAQAWAVEMSQFPLPLNAANHHSPPFTGSSYPFQSIPNSVQWTSAFENVGYSTVGGGETPNDVIDRLFYSPNGFGFMSSPGHKCNILETAAIDVGLGAYVDSNGAAWVVQVFWGTAYPLPAPIGECASVVGR
ncbi:MAG: CAP domain-containing protein [Acidimicrobiales bacterium]